MQPLNFFNIKVFRKINKEQQVINTFLATFLAKKHILLAAKSSKLYRELCTLHGEGSREMALTVPVNIELLQLVVTALIWP